MTDSEKFDKPMMSDETILLVTPFEDCSYRLSSHMSDYVKVIYPVDQNWHKPLQRIFSKVIIYDYIKRICEIGVKSVNGEIIDLVKREHPKYMFWLPSHREFRETTFDTIRGEGTITIAWFGDDCFRFDYFKWYIPYLDYCVAYDIEAIPKYMELGARVIYTLPSVGIPIERDWSNMEERYEVTFVGSRTADRERYINELKSRKVSLGLWGQGWGSDVFCVSSEEMIDIFASSKINLNFSWFELASKMIMRGRIWEVCLAGGFLLTEYFPGIENYFEIDREIVCFKNAKEMIDKIDYYLTHEAERRAIAKAGWERAARQYTSLQMLSEIFRQIKDDIAVNPKMGNRHNQKLKLPIQGRMQFSGTYLRWGMGFLLANNKALWKDALSLSFSYNPLNIIGWGGYIISFLPSFMCSALIELFIKLYKLLGLQLKV